MRQHLSPLLKWIVRSWIWEERTLKRPARIFIYALVLNGFLVSGAGIQADQSTVISSPLKLVSAPAKARVRGPRLRSESAIVADLSDGSILYEKNSDAVVPIASITKLMTAMVVLDSKQDFDEDITITKDDKDTIRWSASRLPFGTILKRGDLLRLALMASENRAASALARNYPGGKSGFVTAMNRKAGDMGLRGTVFFDPTGISAQNVSSARDLVLLLAEAGTYPTIREFSTTERHEVVIKGRTQAFGNTNLLVRRDSWRIDVSKTGFIKEAGKCLVMQTWISERPLAIVLLDSWGRLTPVGDANRVRKWVERLDVASKT